MKKILLALVVFSFLLGACATEKAEGIPVTVYRSPT